MIFLRRKFQAERFRGLSSLTCEVKIRFSRAFHTPNDQTHPVPTQISLVNWQRGALIFHNRGESIPMSINFNYSKTRVCRNRLLWIVYKALTICLLKYLAFVANRIPE